MEALKLEASLFKALAHPVRLRILEALRFGEFCVCHLSGMLGKPQAYVSQQLAELREAGLVANRKGGLRVFYSLNGDRIVDLLDAARIFLDSSEKKSQAFSSRPRVPERIPGCECPFCTDG